MTKLLVSLASLGTGGAERVLSILSKPLADNFDEVLYVMWEGGDVFYNIDQRVKLMSLVDSPQKRKRLLQMKAFRDLVKKENPDLILSFLTPYNMLVLLSTIGIKRKIIVAERTDPKRLLPGGKPMLWFRDFLYRFSDGILTQTEYAKSCYKGGLNKKTTVLYNPVKMSEELIGCAQKSKKAHLFVSAGRLEAIKDQTMMINAFNQFLKNHPDYHLVIYGEGPMKGALEKQIKDLHLTESVSLPGRTNDVWSKMINAECFLLTSINEGLSNAMIEAMCLGLPVISTKVAGTSDFIIDGENGFVVDVKDIDAMTERMNRIADSPGLSIKMGDKAKNIYADLNMEVISQKWVDYLQNKII